MKVSLKTENEEHPGNAVQIRGSEGGRRSFTGTSMQSFRWHVPRQPSARLTHDLKLDTVVWLLRCSVFREISMAFFCDYFKRLNCYSLRNQAMASFGKHSRQLALRLDSLLPQVTVVNEADFLDFGGFLPFNSSGLFLSAFDIHSGGIPWSIL